MFNWIKLIERNMRRNLRRTILTILTIALATFIYTVLVSVPASMDRVVKDASGTLRLIINNKTAPWEDLPARYCDDINKMPNVAACVAITGWPATWRDPERAGLRRRRGPRNRRRVSRLRADRGAARRATFREKRSAMVGEILMHKYGWKVGDTVTLRSTDSDHMEMTFLHHGHDGVEALSKYVSDAARLPDGGAQGGRPARRRYRVEHYSARDQQRRDGARWPNRSTSTSPTPTLRRGR